MASTSSVIVPNSILENLKCVRCALYLSVPPIMYDSSQKLVCGRCVDESKKVDPNNYLYDQRSFLQAKAFEAVGSLLLFPCRYVSRGCSELELNWAHVKDHEASCEHQIHKCPLLRSDEKQHTCLHQALRRKARGMRSTSRCHLTSTKQYPVTPIVSCNWDGNTRMLIQHFKENHPHLILNSGSFKLILRSDNQEIRLIPAFNNFFLLRLTSNHQDIMTEVCYIGCDQKTALKYTYKLKLLNSEDNSTVIISNPVKSSYVWNYDKDELLKTDINSVLNILNTNEMLCQISIFNSDDLQQSSKDAQGNSERNRPEEDSASCSTSTGNRHINKDLLSELECPICNEYMVAPIFQCEYGHSICGECKSKISNCATCRAPYKDTRNFALEKLTNYISYPCKNEDSGCNFVGNLTAISEHNLNCRIKYFNCPLKQLQDCTWTGKIEDLRFHVFKKHSHALFDLRKSVAFVLNGTGNTNSVLTYYDDQLFRIWFKHNLGTSKQILWTFQQIGLTPNEIAPYKLEIEFLDQSNNGRKFTVNLLCFGAGNQGDEFKNSLTIHHDSLIPFISNKTILNFKFNIIGP